MKCSNACILQKCTASTGVGIAGVGITGVGKAGVGIAGVGITGVGKAGASRNDSGLKIGQYLPKLCVRVACF